jgi:glycosyltransferase involved in cell wall biosynthesis
MAGVSVVYITHRSGPRFDWFVDSLSAQLGDDDPEVIFVDGLHSPERVAELEQLVRRRFRFRHVPPKPCPYNGPHRLTRMDCFGAASARNTGIVQATGDYVVFVDDCSVLMPAWWQEVRTAARHGYVVAGAYQKHRDMVVKDGTLLDSTTNPADLDVRWHQGDPAALVQIGGGQLYGCSFGSPRELLADVNGLDELCNVCATEDYQLGLRLEWAGERIFYSRRMLTVESADACHGPTPIRIDRSSSPADYLARLRELGVAQRSTDGNWDASHMVLDLTLGTRSVRSLGNYYDLKVLTEAALEATIERFPREYWFDGTPLAEL